MQKPIVMLAVACGLAVAALPSQAHDDGWRKPGLWSVTLTMEGSTQGPVTVHQCSDETVEPDLLLSILPGQEHCLQPRVERSGDALTIHTHCRGHGEVVSESTLALRGDFTRVYEGEALSTRRQGPVVAEQRRTQVKSSWMGGPCLQGMKPGDMRLSNGVVIDVIRSKAETEAAEPLPHTHSHTHSHSHEH